MQNVCWGNFIFDVIILYLYITCNIIRSLNRKLMTFNNICAFVVNTLFVFIFSRIGTTYGYVYTFLHYNNAILRMCRVWKLLWKVIITIVLLIEFLDYGATTHKSYTKDTHSMTDVLLHAWGQRHKTKDICIFCKTNEVLILGNRCNFLFLFRWLFSIFLITNVIKNKSKCTET